MSASGRSRTLAQAWTSTADGVKRTSGFGTVFLTDDHMFENDEFHSGVATLPPDTYGTLAAEQTQRLYYPEFLPDRN